MLQRLQLIEKVLKNLYDDAKELLEECKIDLNDRAGLTTTALIIAAKRSYLDIVRLLLKHGADPNIQDNWNDTALTAVAYRAEPTLIRELLEHGADPNIQGNCGHTALTNAASRGNCPAILELLKYGANIDAQDKYNKRTALGMALSLREDNAARLLIEYGASTHYDAFDWHTREVFDIHLRVYADIIRQKRKERLMECMSVCGHVDENVIWLILDY